MTGESLADQAYRMLKSRILQGELAGDDLLTERALAEQSGISRTPLRSAISRLEQEGVVARLASGTLMIREVSLQQLMEIAEVRRLLEGTAAALAAQRSGGVLSPDLSRSAEAMRAYAEGGTTTFDAFWEEDDAFHRAVADAAGFTLLPGLLADLRETARRCTISRTHVGFADQAAEHVAVIEAIRQGDAPAARAAMEAHFDSVRQRFLDWLMRR